MTTKQVIFVRGGKLQDRVVWRYFHFHPTKAVKLGVVKLIYFDYPEGKLKVWNRWIPKHGEAAATEPDMAADISPTINIRFEGGSIETSEKRPSVLGLYDFVKRQPKGSIVSLQIFSHADYDGPIIWRDSCEREDIRYDFALDRDPNDSEFRRRDFFGKNPLAGIEGAKFAQALAPGALVKIWGCTENIDCRGMIQDYDQLSRDKKNDTERRVILKRYLHIVDKAYALLLSRLLNQTVWSAPIGWSTKAWGDQKYVGTFPPNLSSELWWRVLAFVGHYRRFYTHVLGAKLDATDYVGFHPTWFILARRKLNTP